MSLSRIVLSALLLARAAACGDGPAQRASAPEHASGTAPEAASSISAGEDDDEVRRVLDPIDAQRRVPLPESLVLRWYVTQPLWGTQTFELDAQGRGHYSFEPAEGVSQPRVERAVVLDTETRSRLEAALRSGGFCAQRSGRLGIPDEGRPSLSARLDGALCEVTLWDGEWQVPPASAVYEMLGALFIDRAAPASGVEREVEEWLDRAAVAPHNGTNPQLPLAPRLIVEGAATFERAIVQGPELRRRDAASALSQHPQPSAMVAFWRGQLGHEDASIRSSAFYNIHRAPSSEDLEPLLRAWSAGSAQERDVAVYLRAWPDRRIVPVLAELLESTGVDVAENAAISLSLAPDVPRLEEEALPGAVAEHRCLSPEAAARVPPGSPRCLWESAESSLALAYRRWWRDGGKAAFAAEHRWWRRFADAHRRGRAIRR